MDAAGMNAGAAAGTGGRTRARGPVRVMRCIPFAGRVRTLLLLACAALALAASPAHADEPDDASAKPVGRWQDASLEDYRRHLVALQGLTQACAKARNVKSCDPTLVGPDDRVPMGASANAERRIVRYGWLRILFSHAEEPDKTAEAPGAHKPWNTAIRQTRRGCGSSPRLPSFSRKLNSAWPATWSRPGRVPRRRRSTTWNVPSSSRCWRGASSAT